LDGHKYQEIFPFLQDFQIYWNIGSQVVPDDSLDFLGVCCYLPFFVSDFTNIGLFPPNFTQSCQGLINIVYFFKEPAFGFIESLYFFLAFLFSFVFWSSIHSFLHLFLLFLSFCLFWILFVHVSIGV
jgi:hypothetical protein